MCDGERMHDVRLARTARLLLMMFGGEVVGALQRGQILFGPKRPDLSLQAAV
jgi:hypothetical protein